MDNITTITATEEWRPLDWLGWEVSNRGRVRRHGGRILKPYLCANGYLRIACAAARRTFAIHRLVAWAFPEICGGWTPGREIDHRNGVKSDNRPENLRWVTHDENVAFYQPRNVSRRSVVATIAEKAAKTPSDGVRTARTADDASVTADEREGANFAASRGGAIRWESVSAAARAIGVTKQAISIAIRRGSTCCGMSWKFAEV